MAVNHAFVALYHEYLSVVNNQAAAAALVLLDVLGQGEPRVHYLLTGDHPENVIVRDEKVEVVQDQPAPSPKGKWEYKADLGIKVRESSHADALAEAAAEKDAVALEDKKQEDEWAALLKAYKKLKHGK